MGKNQCVRLCVSSFHLAYIVWHPANDLNPIRAIADRCLFSDWCFNLENRADARRCVRITSCTSCKVIVRMGSQAYIRQYADISDLPLIRNLSTPSTAKTKISWWNSRILLEGLTLSLSYWQHASCSQRGITWAYDFCWSFSYTFLFCSFLVIAFGENAHGRFWRFLCQTTRFHTRLYLLGGLTLKSFNWSFIPQKLKIGIS
jgi:hypothetical protein